MLIIFNLLHKHIEYIHIDKLEYRRVWQRYGFMLGSSEMRQN